MEHSSHGCSERVVVRVERRRVVRAAPWSEVLGGSEQRFDGLVSKNYQGGYRLEACRPGLIATCHADALHDLLTAELLQVVGRAGGTILCECLWIPRPERSFRGRTLRAAMGSAKANISSSRTRSLRPFNLKARAPSKSTS